MSDTDPRKGADDDEVRLYRTGPLLVMASIIFMSAVGFFKYTYDDQQPARPDNIALGCLRFTGQDINANVGEIQIIDAAVNYGKCSLSLQSLDRLNHDVAVGGHSRLRLVSPLFAGNIEPISQEVQVIKESGDSGRWSWEVRPDKPGDHRLSLVLTIFGPDGKQVQVENNRVEIRLHATGDVGYYASLWWTRITGFIASLQGLVVAIAAIVAVMGGAAIRKRRNEPSQRLLPRHRL